MKTLKFKFSTKFLLVVLIGLMTSSLTQAAESAKNVKCLNLEEIWRHHVNTPAMQSKTYLTDMDGLDGFPPDQKALIIGRSLQGQDHFLADRPIIQKGCDKVLFSGMPFRIKRYTENELYFETDKRLDDHGTSAKETFSYKRIGPNKIQVEYVIPVTTAVQGCAVQRALTKSTFIVVSEENGVPEPEAMSQRLLNQVITGLTPADSSQHSCSEASDAMVKPASGGSSTGYQLDTEAKASAAI